MTLEFVEDQEEGERIVAYGDVPLPVDVPGRLRLHEGRGECRLAAEAMVAECAIGAGSVTVIADAAVLAEPHDSDLAVRENALRGLLTRLERDRRE